MEPVTRKEHFLARIAGKANNPFLFPITREEFFLNDIAKSVSNLFIETKSIVYQPPITVSLFDKDAAMMPLTARPATPAIGGLLVANRVYVDGKYAGLCTGPLEPDGRYGLPMSPLVGGYWEYRTGNNDDYQIYYHAQNYEKYLGEHTISIQLETLALTENYAYARGLAEYLDSQAGGGQMV